MDTYRLKNTSKNLSHPTEKTYQEKISIAEKEINV